MQFHFNAANCCRLLKPQDTLIYKLRTFYFVTWLSFFSVLMFCSYCDCTDECILGIKILIFYLSIFSIISTLNLFDSIIFFEAIGILSFRLIGHYAFRISAARVASIAISIYKIGDLFLIIVIFWIGVNNSDILNNWVITIFILTCGIKSISFLSFLWLLDAMEGPSPISALLHSATLVISGIIVILRNAQINCCDLLLCFFVFGFLITANTIQIDTDLKKKKRLLQFQLA